MLMRHSAQVWCVFLQNHISLAEMSGQVCFIISRSLAAPGETLSFAADAPPGTDGHSSTHMIWRHMNLIQARLPLHMVACIPDLNS
jgi:hypothetical protein